MAAEQWELELEIKRLLSEGDRLFQDGKYKDALTVRERAAVMSKKTLGSEHPITADSINILGYTHLIMGQYEKARPLLQQAVDTGQKTLGPGHRRTGVYLMDLALLRRKQGAFEDALTMYQRALTIQEKASGSEHLETANVLESLALLYADMGEYDRTLELLERTLEIKEKQAGPEHPWTAKTLGNLGVYYMEVGQYDRALQLLQRGLSIDEKFLGTAHPQTAASLHNMARVYAAMGQYDRAISSIERSLKIHETVFGQYHPNTATSLESLSYMYEATGQLQRALSATERAVAIFNKVSGLDNPQTVPSQLNLARMYFIMQKNEEALSLSQKIIAIVEKSLGQNHAYIARALGRQADHFERTGQYERALPLNLRALAIDEKAFGLEHEWTAWDLNAVGFCYFQMGQVEESLPFLHRAFRMSLQDYSRRRLSIVAANLGKVYARTKDIDAAMFYYKISVNASQQLRESSRRLEPEIQRSLTRSMEWIYKELAELLIGHGRLTEAENVLTMLKDQEHFEYVREDITSIYGTRRVTFSAKEQMLFDRLWKSAHVLNNVHTELKAIDRRKGNSPQSQREREDVRERLAMESEGFDQLLTNIEAQLLNKNLDEGQKGIAQVSSIGVIKRAVDELAEVTTANPAVVYFLPSRKDTTFLVSTKTGSYDMHGGLGEDQLNELIRALRSAIDRRDSSYQASAAQLYQALIDPIEPRLKNEKIDTLMLYLVDSLRYLPFSALFDAVNGKHLITREFPTWEGGGVSRAPSVARLVL